MKTKEEKFEVGVWYVVTYSNETKRTFLVQGGEPPLIMVEGEGQMTLEQLLRDYIRVEPLNE